MAMGMEKLLAQVAEAPDMVAKDVNGEVAVMYLPAHVDVPARKVVGSGELVLVAGGVDAGPLSASLAELPMAVYVGNAPSGSTPSLSGSFAVAAADGRSHTVDIGAMAPLPLRAARGVLGEVVAARRDGFDPLAHATVLVLTSAEDHGYVETAAYTYLGLAPGDGAGQLFKIWADGTLRSSQVLLVEADDYPADASYSYSAVYDFFQVDDAGEADCEPPSVALEVAWSGAEHLGRGVLGAPPLTVDWAVLKLVPRVGSELAPLAPALAALRQLVALNQVRTGAEWPAAPSAPAKADYLDEYAGHEDDIAAHGGTMDPALFGPPAPKDDSALGSASPARRTDLDFTERLWLFLKDAASLDDLTACLRHIFDKLLAGDFQPVIHRTNSTALGLLLRQSVKAMLTNTGELGGAGAASTADELAQAFDYWLDEPVECLVEIGIYYLQRNYSAWLTSHSLCTYTQIEPYLDPTAETREALEALLRLHALLDTCLLANAAGAPYDALRSLCTLALSRYASADGVSSVSAAAAAAYGLIDDVNAFDLDAALAKIPFLEFRIPLPVFSQATSRAIDALKAETPESWTMVVTSDATAATAAPTGAPAAPAVRVTHVARSETSMLAMPDASTLNALETQAKDADLADAVYLTYSATTTPVF
ncbi:uncharacterized protein AMSG_04347 [Thecamonas trahens ATCC 50062]|uniref:Uncharacterized protein n=1 Tax=Thecamonas trahens ATCC 50062 TaxID=461836 RepID=A0A0L0D6X8_THETB|nr:hypothetical protein AMSG_04347 [Thecamonas trahens ATCC 50062]KNC48117.1 hypothetical protein AMSG_04347 [Thecamonas trahens ATCC 50062]|eukprot:XP_013758690.1 hypothetical protein AMSG_04347 [Thecamonas trahens ATCC 50062]